MSRKPHEEMAEHWPSADTVFAAPMIEIPKVVFSKTLTSAEWSVRASASGTPRITKQPEGAIVVTESRREVPSTPDFEVRATAPGEKLP
jgi:hypothetical protein